MRPLLVGEANPYGGDPQYALFPFPENSAGGRLCHKVFGLTRREYLERFDRANLCPTRWSMREARGRACELEAQPGDRTLVLLGARVAAAFDVANRHTPYEPFLVRDRRVNGHLVRLAVIPHPSGRSRAWNAPDSYERARSVLREVGAI